MVESLPPYDIESAAPSYASPQPVVRFSWKSIIHEPELLSPSASLRHVSQCTSRPLSGREGST